jgi:hypothetical protein
VVGGHPRRVRISDNRSNGPVSMTPCVTEERGDGEGAVLEELRTYLCCQIDLDTIDISLSLICTCVYFEYLRSARQ